MLQPVNLVPRNRWREEARAALAQAGLVQHESASVGSLPYGLQKRIELVRAMMTRPRLLLLDEPAAGLNAHETEALAAVIQELNRKGTTVLLIEHDMALVTRIAQRIAVLDFGCKITEGTPDEIFDHTREPETKKFLDAVL